VGLADALVHEPELIILDEPTIGFDPNQQRAVRQLIKDLGKKHTVLISTHILSEVEMTCGRVLILDHGRLRKADTTENVRRLIGGGQIIAELRAPQADLQQCWEQTGEIEHFTITAAEGDYWRCALTPRDGADLRPHVYEIARERGWTLRELTRRQHSLEDIFVHLTQAEREEHF
jgi:ABC-2 type transport system ATP-binding protein